MDWNDLALDPLDRTRLGRRGSPSSVTPRTALSSTMWNTMTSPTQGLTRGCPDPWAGVRVGMLHRASW